MYRITLLIPLVFIMIGQVYADVDSFTDRVIEAEQAPKPETPPTSGDAQSSKPKTPPTSGGAQSSNSDSPSLLALLTGILWLYDNFYIYYADYPYQEGGYIRRPVSERFTNVMTYPDDAKYYWFSTSLSGFYFNGIGAGAWASFSGNVYKFIGPYADAYFITDSQEFQIGARLGTHFSLFQSNPFNVGFYIQWQLWKGALSRQGITTGIELRLYPVKPFTFRLKAGAQIFERFTIGEMELEMGIMIKAWECFAGYRSWTFNNETSPSYDGAYLGVRRYF